MEQRTHQDGDTSSSSPPPILLAPLPPQKKRPEGCETTLGAEGASAHRPPDLRGRAFEAQQLRRPRVHQRREKRLEACPAAFFKLALQCLLARTAIHAPALGRSLASVDKLARQGRPFPSPLPSR